MSGIVGSAGSKSGGIGETEIDYEEGTVTNPLIIAGSTTADSYYSSGVRYIKIGKLVNLFVYIDTVDTSPGGALTITLPYASEHLTGDVGNNTGTLWIYDHSSWRTDNMGLYISDASATVSVRHGTFGTFSVSSGNRVILYGGVSYRTA